MDVRERGRTGDVDRENGCAGCAGRSRAEVAETLHDIRGLCTTIGLIADRLARGGDDRSRGCGRTLLRCYDRITELCDARLPTSSEGPGRQDVASVLMDVADLVSSVADSNTRICLDLDADVPVGAAGKALFRVVFNLAINAVHAVNGAGGGRVHLRAFEVDGTVLLDIADDGPGISMAAEADAVGHVAPGLARRCGPGLGLAIAERLAESIGALVVLGPSSRSGTTVHVVVDRAALA